MYASASEAAWSEALGRRRAEGESAMPDWRLISHSRNEPRFFYKAVAAPRHPRCPKKARWPKAVSPFSIRGIADSNRASARRARIDERAAEKAYTMYASASEAAWSEALGRRRAEGESAMPDWRLISHSRNEPRFFYKALAAPRHPRCPIKARWQKPSRLFLLGHRGFENEFWYVGNSRKNYMGFIKEQQWEKLSDISRYPQRIWARMVMTRRPA